MEIKNQVVSLSLAKKLKELGVKQQSFFAWSEVKRSSGTNWELTWPDVDEWEGSSFDSWVNNLAAFSAGEIGDIFKKIPYLQAVWMPAWKEDGSESYAKLTDVTSRQKGNRICDVHGKGLTQAEAYGQMLAYLIENNLLPPHQEEGNG